MKLNCSKCDSEIKPEDINISTDLAKCYNCGSIFKASELTSSLEEIKFKPPNGSKISIQKGINGRMDLTLPKKGFTASQIPQLLFSIFWLSFIIFWTWGASQGSIIFAMFSIPFWLVGINMIIGIVNSANEIQNIYIDKYTLKIQRNRPIRSKTFQTKIGDIETIKMKGIKMNPLTMFGNFRQMMKMQSSFGSPIEAPSVITGVKTEHFFEDANDAEQEWVTKLLDTIVKKMKK